MLRRRCEFFALCLLVVAFLAGCSSDEDPTASVYHDAFPVPLDDLAGAYAYADEPQDDPPRSRETTAGIPAQVEDFEQLQLVVVGSWLPARVEVASDAGGTVVYDTLTVGGRLEFRLVVADEPQKSYHALIVPVDEAFVASAPVEADWSGGGVDAADLLLGNLDLTLSCDLGLGDEQRVLEPAHGTLTSVRLDLLEADVLETGG